MSRPPLVGPHYGYQEPPGYLQQQRPGYPPQPYPVSVPQMAPEAAGYQFRYYYEPQIKAPVPDPIMYSPTVRPYQNFNPNQDCEDLREAMKGLGTDEDVLIEILCHRSWQQRCEIEQTYRLMFGKDLAKAIDSETSYNFNRVLKRLLKPPVVLAAYELHKAIEGAGTDEDCLVEILCTKSNQELRVIANKYQEMYGTTLEKDISGDTISKGCYFKSGYFKRLLVSLLSCNRPPDSSPPDWNAAAADAMVLYKAGEDRLGTDEARFNAVLCGRSYSQLRAIFECYTREYNKDIYDVIKSEFSGDIAHALLAVVGAIRNRPAYFASRLHASMAGAGTKDTMLLRIIVGHCDFDLEAIKAAYLRIYGKTLTRAVQEETSGDYRKALLALIGD